MDIHGPGLFSISQNRLPDGDGEDDECLSDGDGDGERKNFNRAIKAASTYIS